MSLVTQDNEKIGKWIDEGRTKLFLDANCGPLLKCFRESYKFAVFMRSYHYPVFRRKKGKITHAGYAVPL